MCWAPSDGSSKLIPIDEQPNHQIVHLFRLGKAPLRRLLSRGKTSPCATFNYFFTVACHLVHPAPTLWPQTHPCFLTRGVGRMAPHQAPIRIKASDVSLPSQTSAPGTFGAPENRQFPAMSTGLLLTNAMTPLGVPFSYGSQQRRRQTPQSDRRPSGIEGGQDESNGWLSTTFPTRLQRSLLGATP